MKPKKEFTMREVTYVSEDYPEMIEVTRTRTSEGSCSIVIGFSGQQITISNNQTDIGDNYEMMARDLASALDAATDNMCHIPIDGMKK